MTRKKPRPDRRRPLIEREITDANFHHCITLMGAVAPWAGEVTEGQRLSSDDLNMVHIPVEIALAFIKNHVDDQTPLGEACRTALATRKAFQEARASIEIGDALR